MHTVPKFTLKLPDKDDWSQHDKTRVSALDLCPWLWCCQWFPIHVEDIATLQHRHLLRAQPHTNAWKLKKQRTFSTSCERLLRWLNAFLADNHRGQKTCKMLMQKKIRCRPKHIFNETLIACMDLRAERTTQNNAGESSESEKRTVYAQFFEHRRTDLQLSTQWCCFVGIKQGLNPVLI